MTKTTPTRYIFGVQCSSWLKWRQNHIFHYCEFPNCLLLTSAPQHSPQTDTAGKQSTEETSDGHREQETSQHPHRTSAEARGRPTVSSPAGPGGLARHPGTRLSPLRSNSRAAPQAPHHTQLAGKSRAERAAPFRNLFKTFDAAVLNTAHYSWKHFSEVHQH